MANEENLKPLSERTKSEQRQIAKKGGKASGIARAKEKTIREALKAVLNGKYEIDGEILNGYEALAIRTFKAAVDGNINAFREIRDTVGEKPTDNLNLGSGEEQVKGISITFVDKSNPKAEEVDPKIVGEYTPGTDTGSE